MAPLLPLLALAIVLAQEATGQVKPTPVPILREINTHNQDGSYTYGYESGDGSYKVETKSQSGEVKGKYGYYDDLGQLREIEYGANNHGFVPTGTGIAPEVSERALLASQNAEKFRAQSGHLTGTNEDDGSYRPDEYESPYAYRTEAEGQVPNNQNAQPYYQQGQQSLQGFLPARTPGQSQDRVSRRQQQRQQFQHLSTNTPQTYEYQAQNQGGSNAGYYNDAFRGHPASNFQFNSGSYSVNY